MTLTADLPALPQRIAPRLRQRVVELRAMLEQACSGAAPERTGAEVVDFKDVAAQDIRAVVDEASYTQAAAELSQVVAALGRISDGSYGWCEDCGEAIDERRLLALPATPFCTACQALQERNLRRRWHA